MVVSERPCVALVLAAFPAVAGVAHQVQVALVMPQNTDQPVHLVGRVDEINCGNGDVRAGLCAGTAAVVSDVAARHAQAAPAVQGVGQDRGDHLAVHGGVVLQGPPPHGWLLYP